ncbi:hypothetical protein ACFL6C_06850 [Myxococcota bacterium]
MWYGLQSLQSDRDNDGWPDYVDNCPDDANRDQADSDGDGNIRSMRRLADVANAILQTFIRSRRLDLSPITNILIGPLRRG